MNIFTRNLVSKVKWVLSVQNRGKRLFASVIKPKVEAKIVE